MERSALGVPDISCAREAAGNRNPLLTSETQPPRETGSGNFQPSVRVAGFDGPTRPGASTSSTSADDHSKCQRDRASLFNSEASAQILQAERRPAPDRLPAHEVVPV